MARYLFIFFVLWSIFGRIEGKSETVESPDNGFGSNINWQTIGDGLNGKSGKPVMLIFHKSWCKACQALKQKFSSSKEIEDLSRDFVMVNSNDEKESQKSEYDFDGKYVPRIIFFHNNGTILEDIFNEKRKHNKYFYSKPEDILASMKKVLELQKVLELKKDDSKALGRGFGDKIKWLTFPEGEEKSRKSGKPMMIVIHKSWCGSCKILKPKFAASKEILKLSENFVMVNTEDEEEPKDSKFVIDGAYIPRLFFVESNGRVMSEVWNERTTFPEVKYYYGEPSQIVRSMKLVMEKEKNSSKLHNGFGEDIKWLTFPDGETESTRSGKPMMLLIHKTWCGSCKNLKPKFAASKEIQELSENFVMVNTEDDDEPKDSKFVIDGAYIPRIFFVESNGRVMDEIWNEGTSFPHVKYYYGEPDQIVRSMRLVIDKENNSSKLHNGWGKAIKWESLENGKKLYRQRNVPMLLIIHKSWCKACKLLKSYFSKSEEIAKLSSNFVMVNVKDENEELGAEYDVDGAYVPRLYFFDPQTGKIMEENYNEDPAYKDDFIYSYGNDKHVANIMKKVLEERDSKKTDFSAGFGGNISWISLEDSSESARESNKPIMLIFHRSWCKFSQELKEEFAMSFDIEEISKYFVMVNVEDEEIPEDKKYNIDGTYVPRILFLNSSGDVDETIMNENRRDKKSKYFYQDGIDVVESMKLMLEKQTQPALDRGFGSQIDWMTMDNALKEATAKGKPIFLIIHKTWCGACQALKGVFNGSKEITAYSKHFTMVNLEDEEEPEDEQYDVDGKYIPRIFILDPQGVVQPDLHNMDPDYLEYKFSHGFERSIIRVMNDALEKFKKDDSKDHGFGENINWVSYKDGVEESKRSGKPMFLILHKSWCSACKALKKKVMVSTKFEELSQHFVMVNSEDDEEPEDELFEIDGSYFPRTFFIDPSGDIMTDIVNLEIIYKENKYYYWDAESLVESMEKALDKLKMRTNQKDEL